MVAHSVGNFVAARKAAAVAKAKKLVTLKFRLHYKANYSQKLCLVGSHDQLGSWVVQQGVPLVWSAGHWWTATVAVPVNSTFEYKYVVVDSAFQEVRWQDGTNAVLDVTEAAAQASHEAHSHGSLAAGSLALPAAVASRSLALEVRDTWCKTDRTIVPITDAEDIASTAAQEGSKRARAAKQQERANVLAAGDIRREAADGSAHAEAVLSSTPLPAEELVPLLDHSLPPPLSAPTPMSASTPAPAPWNAPSLAACLRDAASKAERAHSTPDSVAPSLLLSKLQLLPPQQLQDTLQHAMAAGLAVAAATQPRLVTSELASSMVSQADKLLDTPPCAASPLAGAQLPAQVAVPSVSPQAPQKQQQQQRAVGPQEMIPARTPLLSPPSSTDIVIRPTGLVPEYSVSYMHSPFELDVYTMYHQQVLQSVHRAHATVPLRISDASSSTSSAASKNGGAPAVPSGLSRRTMPPCAPTPTTSQAGGGSLSHSTTRRRPDSRTGAPPGPPAEPSGSNPSHAHPPSPPSHPSTAVTGGEAHTQKQLPLPCGRTARDTTSGPQVLYAPAASDHGTSTPPEPPMHAPFPPPQAVSHSTEPCNWPAAVRAHSARSGGAEPAGGPRSMAAYEVAAAMLAAAASNTASPMPEAVAGSSSEVSSPDADDSLTQASPHASLAAAPSPVHVAAQAVEHSLDPSHSAPQSTVHTPPTDAAAARTWGAATHPDHGRDHASPLQHKSGESTSAPQATATTAAVSAPAAAEASGSSADWPGRTLFELQRVRGSVSASLDEDDEDLVNLAAVFGGASSLGREDPWGPGGVGAVGAGVRGDAAQVAAGASSSPAAWTTAGPGGDVLRAAPASEEAAAQLVKALGAALGTSVRLRAQGGDAATLSLLELDRQIALAASGLYSQKDPLLEEFVRREGAKRLARLMGPTPPSAQHASLSAAHQ